MNTKMGSWIFILCLSGLLLASMALGQDKKEFTYGGVKTCKACHMTKKSGAQYKIWAAGPHAKAFETLKGEEAKKIAAEKDIKDPSTSDACLKCHVTAFGVDAKLKGPKLTMEEGVGCEVCHGPGSGYKSKKVMAAIWAGTEDAAKHGLVMPTEEVCVKCHNEESPRYKEFKFEESAKAIAHPVPKEKAASK